MKKMTLFAFSVLAILLLGCASIESPPNEIPKTNAPTQSDLDSMLVCSSDSDCICDGFDENKDRCYLGNTDYYNKYVNKSRDCPDFCTGIAGNLAVKCVDSRCMQMLGCLTDSDCDKGEKCSQNRCLPGTAAQPAGTECKLDSDCAKAGCSSERCVPASKAGDMVSICLYRPEYDCLKMVSCGCDNGKCAWSTSAEYESCVSDAKASGSVGPE